MAMAQLVSIQLGLVTRGDKTFSNHNRLGHNMGARETKWNLSSYRPVAKRAANQVTSLVVRTKLVVANSTPGVVIVDFKTTFVDCVAANKTC